MRPKAFPANRSLFVLIIANLLPIAGVLFLDWDVFEIVVLYWFENLVIGAINVLKMITCCSQSIAPVGGSGERMPNAADQKLEHSIDKGAKLEAYQPSRWFIVPFFTVHYGMFCFVHGVFVFVLLGGKSGRLSQRGNPIEGLGETLGGLFGSGAVIFVLAIVFSHLYSFFTNFIGKGEYRRVSAPQLMGAPYGRIVVRHVAILFGAVAVTAFGNSVMLLLLLIIGKIVLDSKMHLRSHQKSELGGQKA